MKLHLTFTRVIFVVFFCFLNLFADFYAAHAQGKIYIPDNGFRQFLKYRYPSCVVGDSLILDCNEVINTTELNINQSSYSPKNIEGIQAFKNLTVLDCQGNLLTSLSTELPNKIQILTCGSNQITSLPPLPNTLKELYCSFNQLSSLPNLPNSLVRLKCIRNNISSLPMLPANLELLHCIGNPLPILPTLPSNLKEILCGGSAMLVSLPILPDSLQILQCIASGLESLPPLPNNLKTLFCYGNKLSSLPTLPNSLEILYCTNNAITCLPNIPTNPNFYSDCGRTLCSDLSKPKMYIPDPNFRTFLKEKYPSCMVGDSLVLGCDAVVNETELNISGGFYNYSPKIVSLTGLEAFTNLQTLDCSLNKLTSLPTLPNSLQTLDCGYNRLTSLPTLPNSLKDLKCTFNQLTSLPTLPNSLQTLDCGNNQLTSLPTLPNSLQTLKFFANLFTSLPTLPNSLKDLNCGGNQLTSLPILPSNLQTLNCQGNQLTSLPTLPNSLKDLTCNPNHINFIPFLPNNLERLHTGEGIVCLPNIPSNPNFRYEFAELNVRVCPKFTPNNNSITNQVVITGNGFVNVTSVKFNGVEASSFKVNSPTQITAIVPANATTGKIMVETPTDIYYGRQISREDFIIIESLNKIQGILVHDINTNCQNDNLEKGIPNIMVKAGDYYGSTDKDGKYEIAVPSGTYPITQILPQKLTQIIVPTCEKSYTTTFAGTGETKTGFDFFNKVVDCAYLTVDIGSDRRRRCFENRTTVLYKNSGFGDAENVVIHVLFPKYVRPLRSTRAWASQQDSLLVFNIGKVKAGESGQFIITDIVSCDNESIRGLTQCTKAVIFPKSACGTSPSWNKSEVSPTVTCLFNSIAQITLINTGEADMSEPTSYRIFLEGLVVKTDKILLKKGESQKIQLPTFGKTVRIEADQPAFHPQGSYLSATLEACGRPIVATFTRTEAAASAASLFPEKGNYNEAISCMEIRDSYDPNDKQVFPLGVESVITKTDELEYLIRFQNTGSDTAYTVVVRDTLDLNLDLATFETGASSHAYTWSVSGKGKPIITWTFAKINLPHKAIDEPGSNGFIKFKIKQKADNPFGTVLKNKAGIYFDFNSPIITNEVISTIGNPIAFAAAPTNFALCDDNTVPTKAVAGEDITTDQNEVQLTANKPELGAGRWKVVKGTGTFTDAENPKTKVKDLGMGENSFAWQITICEKTSTDEQKVTRNLAETANITCPVGCADKGENQRFAVVGTVSLDGKVFKVEGILDINEDETKASVCGKVIDETANFNGRGKFVFEKIDGCLTVKATESFIVDENGKVVYLLDIPSLATCLTPLKIDKLTGKVEAGFSFKKSKVADDPDFKGTLNLQLRPICTDCEDFAKSIVSYNKTLRKDGNPIEINRVTASRALGAPQENDEYNFVSLGFGGDITLELASPVTDFNQGVKVGHPNFVQGKENSGGDLIVVETSFGRADQNCGIAQNENYPERAEFWGSESLNKPFVKLQEGCRTTFVDVKNAIAAGHKFVKYLKIIDISDKTLFEDTDDGYDIDGIIVCPENVLAAITGTGRKAVLNGRAEESKALFQADFFNRASNGQEHYSLQVYPNPAESKVFLQMNFSKQKQVLIQVFDLTGKEVRNSSQSVKSGANQLEVSLLDQSKGLYLVKVSTEDGKWSKTVKVVKE